MYLSKSLIDGLKILGFDKQTIKTISKEKSLEEIFLSTLFLNYLIFLRTNCKFQLYPTNACLLTHNTFL